MTLWIKLWHHTWPQLLPLYLNLSSFWTNFLSKGYNMWDTYDTICSSTRIRNMFCIKGYGMLTWLILFVSSLAIIDLDIVDVVGSGMVADGTPCGSGKVCINFMIIFTKRSVTQSWRKSVLVNSHSLNFINNKICSYLKYTRNKATGCYDIVNIIMKRQNLIIFYQCQQISRRF